ncbi:C39 family peptidase [Lactobacillus sp. ESL0684]|uniref:C39 family peptidase n=1 Tax=Lactobacillus sp. ESL0684 TaxID=2983213 RepID=UPI0023F6B7DD|nr:C39 family peptidase [Lactobacillus sp. ESL0684]WEV44141.1 C39 family peptidase [Lactobacillus sp. ESL0684]
MKKTKVITKLVTFSAAILLAAPVAMPTAVALAAEEPATTEAQPTSPATDAGQTANTTSPTATTSEKPAGTATTTAAKPVAKPAKKKQSSTKAKKVKSFKVYIIKKNYGIYTGNFANKKSASKYFHKPYTVKKSFKHNKKTYYWLYKGKKTIGYINKKAVAKSSQKKLVKVPYVSQYTPVKTPWGCAGASLAMMLGYKGQKITTSLLQKIQNNLPMQPTKGGQKGNVYTGEGFGYVISPGALTKYGHTFKKGKDLTNITSKKPTVNDFRMYIQAGKPVLYYGFSSYQKAGDYNRNHCKVITGYKNGKFRVYDPLYYSKNAGAGTGGKNMNYDHGAIAWVTKKQIQNEYNHKAITFK